MSNIDKIKEVKSKVDIIQVAERYGIKLKKNKGLCPFHSEKSPSFSINQEKQIFHCFGCGMGGDVITLVEKLLGVNSLEATKIINNDFCCGVELDKPVDKQQIKKYERQRELEKQFDEWYQGTIKKLCKYERELIRVREIQDINDDNFVKSLQDLDKIGYFIDLLLNANDEQKLRFWKTNKEVVRMIEVKVS